MFTPSRIAVYLAALAALAGALAPAVANLDWTSTAGVIAAVVTIGGVVARWLVGRSKWETVHGWRELDPPSMGIFGEVNEAKIAAQPIPPEPVEEPLAHPDSPPSSLHANLDG